jgi:hypothetical protein
MARIIPIDSVLASSSPRPISYREARFQYENHRNLLNKFFINSRGNLMTVEAILICPFDNLNKWKFVNLYLRNSDNKQALSFYNLNEYDIVLLISEVTDTGKVQYSIEKPEILRHDFHMA